MATEKTMDIAELENLKKLARQATPGEWLYCFSRGRREGWIIDEQHKDVLKEVPIFRENAAYIAAANPSVMLALIAGLDSLKEEIERLKKECEAQAKVARDFKRITTNLANEIDENDEISDEEEARLEKEADWLASLLPMSEHDDNAEEAIYRWREAARKAVEEPCGK